MHRTPIAQRVQAVTVNDYCITTPVTVAVIVNMRASGSSIRPIPPGRHVSPWYTPTQRTAHAQPIHNIHGNTKYDRNQHEHRSCNHDARQHTKRADNTRLGLLRCRELLMRMHSGDLWRGPSVSPSACGNTIHPVLQRLRIPLRQR